MTNDNSDTIRQSRRRMIQALSLLSAGGAASCGKTDRDPGLSIEALRVRIDGSRNPLDGRTAEGDPAFDRTTAHPARSRPEIRSR